MSEYAVSFARSARKELQALDRVVTRRVFAAIERLAHEPRPAGCRKLQGVRNLWRVRIGDYRVIYSVDDRQRLVDDSAVRHRSDVLPLAL